MKNIFHIHSKKKKKNLANQDVIDSLEELLELARKGEVIALAGVVLTDRDTMINKYSGDIMNNYLSFQGMLNDLSSELKHNYGDH